ncbi:hypothetical protein PIIN_00346 [Serendipita indica DSM 11827]|uniref:Uncharacterized protein n=1 Tax=Serendipita indica (strain DSM 11827) TaxID=1109443 RepID=G4T5P1_SERID|nr:hypothetical protein PIIN_00346 [Serendipita indica DSM 11827]
MIPASQLGSSLAGSLTLYALSRGFQHGPTAEKIGDLLLNNLNSPFGAICTVLLAQSSSPLLDIIKALPISYDRINHFNINAQTQRDLLATS